MELEVRHRLRKVALVLTEVLIRSTESGSMEDFLSYTREVSENWSGNERTRRLGFTNPGTLQTRHCE